jgi:plastocyanin
MPFRFNFSRKTLVIALCIFLVIAVAYVGNAASTDNGHIVVTPSGFEPAEVTIGVGGSVTFENKSGRNMWPASDPHPTHTRFSAFDPKKSIADGESWSVTFPNSGTFRFHDHLSAARHGIVHVNGAWYSGIVRTFSKPDCLAVADGEKDACMEEELRQTIAHEGLKPAFDLFLYYYRNEPKFVQTSCHWHSHLLGEEAYELYAKGESVELIPEVSYCGYGFFHGFMARLVNENPDYSEAKRFCETATVAVEKDAPSARANCFHGIGHGFIEDPVPEEYWGKPQELWSRAFPVCDRISENANEREECIEGAFNGVVLFMEAKQFGLSLDYTDLFAWCRKEPHEYQQGCYYEFAQKSDRVIDNDLHNLPALLASVPQEFQKTVVWVASAGVMQQTITASSHLKQYHQCQILGSEELRDTCMEGIVSGYRAHGEPGVAHERALTFCGDSEVADTDKGRCYAKVIATFSTIYNTEKLREICSHIPEAYRASACARVE